MAHYKKQSECGSYNFLLHLPEGCRDERRNASGNAPASGWPLILFLHGADRKGVDLDALRSTGIARLCEDRFEVSSCSGAEARTIVDKLKARVGEDEEGALSDVEEMVDAGADVESEGMASLPLEGTVDAVDADADSPRSVAANLNMEHASALARRQPHRRTPSTACDMSGCSAMPRMQSFPFIVVSPLCPPFKYWRVESLASLLEEVCEQYHVDRRRVYAVGEGMGGWAACALAAKIPRCVAACVPIGAAIDPELVDVERLKDTPMWIFHGHADAGTTQLDDDADEEDDTNSCDAEDGLRASMHLARALRRQGARSVLFTAYPIKTEDACSLEEENDADSMPGVYAFPRSGSSSVVGDENDLIKRSYTYDNPLLYQWLLQHTLPLQDV